MRITFIILFFLIHTAAFSQGLDNQWILGYDSIYMVTTGRTTIDFSSGSPVLSWKNRQLNFQTTEASICDKNGNMLFYTNGVYIANSLDDTMLNGSGLNPSAYTTTCNYHGLAIPQADLIIPFPADSSKYYLFHETVDVHGYNPYYLYYSIIDMSLDNGFGGVASKNNVLITDSLVPGYLTACKHANGRDWWIISHQYNSDLYYKFLVTPSGISGPFTQNIGKVMDIFGPGQICFSPNGEKFVDYHTENDMDLMDFDRCTGDFSNLIHVDINDSAVCAGAAFSPNSQVLYLSSMKYVYQFDLSSSNIPATQTTVAVWDGFASPGPLYATTFFLAQLAPDGKIYVCCSNGTDYLHIINYPDSVGIGCDVCQHCQHLLTYNATALPIYPNYFLEAEHNSICDSLITDVPFISSVQSFNIFPNPAHNILYITQNKNEIFKSISIFNSIGQKQTINYSSIKNGEYMEVNVSSLAPGIYFLEMMTEKQKVVHRFVKE